MGTKKVLQCLKTRPRVRTFASAISSQLILVDLCWPPSAEFCRTVANFPQVDDLRFINPWDA